MTFCNEHGLAHSAFLEWEPEDRAKALAYMLEKAERCELCGTADWEWDEDPYAYRPEERLCRGCYQKSAAGEEGSTMAGVSIVMVPRRAAGKKIKAKRPGRKRSE